MSINLSNIAILNIKSATYGFIISRIIKNEAIIFFFRIIIYSHKKKTLQGLQALQSNNNTKLIIKINNS